MPCDVLVTCAPPWKTRAGCVSRVVAINLVDETSSYLFRDDILSSGKYLDGRPTSVRVVVQTDYRESEAQTDPYSPDYVVQPGTSPSELLQLATLSWGTTTHMSQVLSLTDLTGIFFLFGITFTPFLAHQAMVFLQALRK